jgi:hypothetical protein
MQTAVEKRMSGGLSFQMSWTYSKFMEAIEQVTASIPAVPDEAADAAYAEPEAPTPKYAACWNL